MLIFDPETVGQNLKRIRLRAGISQVKLAEAAHMTPQGYIDIETGRSNMKMDTLLFLCDALNITPNDILTADEPCLITDEEINALIAKTDSHERDTLLRIMKVYLESLKWGRPAAE